MNEKAQEIAELLDKGEKVQAEFKELEQNEVGFDGNEVLGYMEENKIDSPKEAYRKMNGLEPASQTNETSSLAERMRENLYPQGQTGSPSPKTNSGFDDLRDRMKDFFNREK